MLKNNRKQEIYDEKNTLVYFVSNNQYSTITQSYMYKLLIFTFICLPIQKKRKNKNYSVKKSMKENINVNETEVITIYNRIW